MCARPAGSRRRATSSCASGASSGAWAIRTSRPGSRVGSPNGPSPFLRACVGDQAAPRRHRPRRPVAARPPRQEERPVWALLRPRGHTVGGPEAPSGGCLPAGGAPSCLHWCGSGAPERASPLTSWSGFISRGGALLNSLRSENTIDPGLPLFVNVCPSRPEVLRASVHQDASTTRTITHSVTSATRTTRITSNASHSYNISDSRNTSSTSDTSDTINIISTRNKRHH